MMSLHDLNPDDSSFSADFWLWFTYPKNKNLKPLETREIINAKIANTLVSDVTETQSGMMWASEKIKGTFLHDWETNNFPFDQQKLHIVIEEAFLETGDFMYVPDKKGSRISEEIKLDGWKIIDFKLESKDRLYDTNFGNPDSQENSQYPRLVATITLSRKAIGLFFKLHTGLYVAFAISMLSFFMSAASDDVYTGRVSVLIGMLFAGIINLQAVESTIGSSQDMTLVDKLHFVTFAIIFVSIIFSIISRWLCSKDKEAQAIRLDRRAFVYLILVYIGINFFLIGLARAGG